MMNSESVLRRTRIWKVRQLRCQRAVIITAVTILTILAVRFLWLRLEGWFYNSAFWTGLSSRRRDLIAGMVLLSGSGYLLRIFTIDREVPALQRRARIVLTAVVFVWGAFRLLRAGGFSF